MKRLSAFAIIAAIAAGALLCEPALSDELGKSPHRSHASRRHASTDRGAASAKVVAFAQSACGDCHAVRSPGISPNPEAPTFADIANRADLTAETLSKWLRDAHNYPAAMNFDLHRHDVDVLSAYILTLRSESYKPPIN